MRFEFNKIQENIQIQFVAVIFIILSYIELVLKVDNFQVFNLYFYTFFIISGLILIYISYIDIIYLEVPAFKIYFVWLFGFVFNLVLLITDYPLRISNEIIINPVNNLLIGFIVAFVGVSLYLLTQRRGFGEADIFLFSFMGLVLGSDFYIGFYLAIFSSAIFSLYQIYQLRKIKEVKVPLIPFITYGIVFTVLFL